MFPKLVSASVRNTQNPYHTKKSKELDDNSPTKCDKKDAITIARLVKDGRFFDPYLPQDVYAELRVLSNARISGFCQVNVGKTFSHKISVSKF